VAACTAYIRPERRTHSRRLDDAWCEAVIAQFADAHPESREKLQTASQA